MTSSSVWWTLEVFYTMEISYKYMKHAFNQSYKNTKLHLGTE